MNTTVNALLDRYIVEILPTLSERTRSDYSKYTIPKLRARWGERIADEIKPREFGEWLWSSPQGRIQRTRILAPLAAAYTAGYGRWWMCETRPIHGIQKPKAKPRKHLITKEEYQEMVRLAPPRIGLLMALALLTGQRQGDVLSLKWSQVRGGRINFVQGKTGKELSIGLNPQIKRVLGRCARYSLVAGHESEYVMISRKGTRYSSEGFRAMFTRMQRKYAAMGKRRARFHDLRKMAATNSKSKKDAQLLLGHDDIKMTDKHYWCKGDEAPGLEVDFDPI